MLYFPTMYVYCLYIYIYIDDTIVNCISLLATYFKHSSQKMHVVLSVYIVNIFIQICVFSQVRLHKLTSGTCAIRHLSFLAPGDIRNISLVLGCVVLDRFHCIYSHIKRLFFECLDEFSVKVVIVLILKLAYRTL